MTSVRKFSHLSFYFSLAFSLFLLTNTMLFYSIQYSNAFSPSNSTSTGDFDHRPIAKSITIPIKNSLPVSFVLNATDLDKNDTITFVLVKNPDWGRIATLDPSTGEGIYAPFMAAGNLYQGFFIFRANDSRGFLSNPATVTFVPSQSK